MAHNSSTDPESILTEQTGEESAETLRLVGHRVIPSPVETAVLHYADSIERLLSADAASPSDLYTQGFVAGLRAAAKVAATVART